MYFINNSIFIPLSSYFKIYILGFVLYLTSRSELIQTVVKDAKLTISSMHK